MDRPAPSRKCPPWKSSSRPPATQKCPRDDAAGTYGQWRRDSIDRPVRPVQIIKYFHSALSSPPGSSGCSIGRTICGAHTRTRGLPIFHLENHFTHLLGWLSAPGRWRQNLISPPEKYELPHRPQNAEDSSAFVIPVSRESPPFPCGITKLQHDLRARKP